MSIQNFHFALKCFTNVNVAPNFVFFARNFLDEKKG